MCGIAGIIKPGELDLGRSVRRMLDSISHRGPEGSAVAGGSGWGLGHALLRITDPYVVAGASLMGDADHHLTYNGEIYNLSHLKSHLGSDLTLRTSTDTEILFHFLKRHKQTRLGEINGVFSFAFLDERSRKLYLVRDPMGVKPIYFARTPEKFVFASEIKAVLAVTDVGRRLSGAALGDYFALGYFPKGSSPYQDIHQLLPGHYLELDLADLTFQIHRYFDLKEIRQDSRRQADLPQKTRSAVLEAFERQFDARVPMGLLLSGGMDSSIISILPRLLGKDPIPAYTLKFQDYPHDESQAARTMASWSGCALHEVPVSAEIYRSHYHAALRALDQPSGDSSFVLSYLLASRASQDVRVLFTGDGGDELFAGYETSSAGIWRERFLSIPSIVRKKILHPVGNMLPDSSDKWGISSKYRLFLKGAEAPLLPMAHFFWRESLSFDLKRRIFKGALKDHLAESHHLFLETYASASHWDEINRQLLIDATVHFSDKVQLKTDRMCMAHSLEARVPLADVELSRFAFSVPGHHKVRNGKLKHLLKRAFQNDLPKNWARRPKHGLSAPVSQWMRNEWASWMDEVFLQDESWHEYLNFNEVAKLWREHLHRRQDHGAVLFTLLGFIEWMRMEPNAGHRLYNGGKSS